MSIIFSGFDIRGRIDDSLTPEYAWNVGKAFADWLPTDGPVVVVHQTVAAPSVTKALIEGVRLQGRSVIDGGEGDEQVARELLADRKAAGAFIVGHDDLQSVEFIQLLQENGVGVTSENGLLAISSLVESGNFVPAAVKGEIL